MAWKILIIEDEPDCRAILEHVLHKGGYSVIAALNGEEGIKACREEKPDLVMLDLNLPDMDGVDVCKKIRAQDSQSKTPILLCTVRSAISSVAEGLNAGADDYVLKPIDESDLLARIQAKLKG